MTCKDGMHSHKGATNCHPISQKHKIKETIMYHQMALQQGKADTDYTEGFSDEQQQRAENVKEKKDKSEEQEKELAFLKDTLNKLIRKITGRNKNVFFPVITAISVLDKTKAITERYVEEHPDQQGEGYKKGFQLIWDYTSQAVDGDTINPKKAEELQDEILKRTKILLANDNAYIKGTAEYGELNCYWHYLNNLKAEVEKAYEIAEFELPSEDFKKDRTYRRVSEAQNEARRLLQARKKQKATTQ